MKSLKADDFNPNKFHPFYFIRKNLLINIEKNASFIHGKVLDFGCGSKPYQRLFNATEYIGLDYENEGHPHDNETIDFFYDGKNFPFENENFDSIITTEVFEHVFNLEELLGELNRVLKKEGYMLITCPFVWNEHEVPFDFARYTQYALKSILEKNGFEWISHNKSGNFITVIFQLINLYLFRKFYFKADKFIVTRIIFKYCFILPINFWGAFFEKLLPKDDSLYLNNIVIVRKLK